ncbi:MAG: c-type cytochrome [Verrucomicrobia bacterium]|nr:c-type cytochrome [Verrucomicrobiota bacterium]
MLRWIGLWLICVVPAAAPLLAQTSGLRAGVHVVDITPTQYPVLVNAMFTERTATNTVDPLTVRALALENGNQRIVLAVVDTCMIARDLIDRAKEQASRATGIPTEHLLVSATHTHSAPSAMGCLGSRMDTNYAAFLEPWIAEAIIGAAQRTVPARVGWGSVDDWTHTFNRRWIRRPDKLITDPFGEPTVKAHMHPGHESPDAVGPSGPVDPGLSVLGVQTLDGQPLAILANYSQHYYGSPLLSSDYYGRFAKYLATQLAPNASAQSPFVAIMSQGTSGDLMWMDYSAPARDIGYDTYAREMAESVAKVWQRLQFRSDVPLGIAERKLELNYRTPDPSRLAWARKVASTVAGRLPATLPEIYALEAIYLHERPRTELKLQALRIGDLGITALPNEVYALTGLKLKAQSPFPTTFNIELANGAEGYIPPPEQHVLGGYTTWPARTAGLEVGAEPKIVDTLLSLLEEISGQPRRPFPTPVGAYPEAVLTSRPLAYWRLEDPVFPQVQDASGNQRDAQHEPGVALFLPGASRTVGFQPPAPDVPNAFTRDVINRSAHYAGGRTVSALPALGRTYSVEFWFWNGLNPQLRPVTGYLFSRGADGDPQAAGDHLGLGGTYRADLPGRLFFFNGNERNTLLVGRTEIPWLTWNHVVLIRDERRVTVYLNGQPTPEISGEADLTWPAGTQTVFFGGRNDRFAPFEGRLDELAVYDRVLTATEVADHVRRSELPNRAQAAAPRPPATTPLSPEDSLRRIHVPAGFTVDLAVAEPIVQSPVALDWDAQGRLWVVEMIDYPLGLDGRGQPGGRIRLLEDSDGDGRYDRSTVFAEGLRYPTGILSWRDGVLVTAAPEILFLRDTTGDGRADVREVLFSGFLEGNQQLRVNGLRWGLDNWVYCASGSHHGGYGAATKIKSHRAGKEYAIGSRDFRFRPDTGELDPQSGPSQFGRNPDNWGHWFGVQNSWPLWHYVLADPYLRRNPYVAAPDPVRQLMGGRNPPVYAVSAPEKRFHSFNEAGHFTSACAAMIYRDDLLFGATPETHAFTCEPFHNLVQHFQMTDDGVSFAARRAEPGNAPDFFASEDRWCRPVMTRAGPDGALWVVDMYRYMIEHPEWLPPEGQADLLPHYRLGEERGRIYRVSAQDRPPRRWTPPARLPLADLVATLGSPNGWLRDQAQMILLWRQDSAAVPLLRNLVAQPPTPLARLHALAVLDGLDALTDRELLLGLADAHPGVRAWSVRLAERQERPEVVRATVALVTDPDLKVRLQLACTLGEWKSPEAGIALGRLALAQPADPYLTAALLSSAVPHAPALVDAVVQAGEPALTTWSAPLLELTLGQPQRAAAARLLQPVLTDSDGRFSAAQLHAFSRLLDLLSRRQQTLAQWTAEDDALSQVLGRSKTLEAFAQKTVANEADPLPDRLAAAGVLARLPERSAEVVPQLVGWLNPRNASDVQQTALRLLGQTGDARVPALLEQAWPYLSPSLRQLALDQCLSREPWAWELAQRLKTGPITPNTLDAAHRNRLLRHSSARVREAAAILNADVPGTRTEVVAAFRPALTLPGDSTKGAALFGRLCASCHRLGDVGTDLGPNLQSVVDHAPERLLVSILDPNATIEPGFTAYTGTLANGEELYGLITAETGNSLVFRQADGRSRTLLRPELTTLTSANTSLMPEGLEAGLQPSDLADLIRYLKSPAR